MKSYKRYHQIETELTLEGKNKETYEKKVNILGSALWSLSSLTASLSRMLITLSNYLKRLVRHWRSCKVVISNLPTSLKDMDVKTLEAERKLYNDRDKEHADLCTEATNLDLSLAQIKIKSISSPTRWQTSEPRLRFMNLTRKQLRIERGLVKEQQDLTNKNDKA